MMLLKYILNLGIENQTPERASKTKLINTVCFITFLISGMYSLNYLFILEEPIVFAINSLFTFAYFIILVFSYFNLPKITKIIFFSLLMLHIIVCTNVYVTKDSGFHLYLFLIPIGSFLLFEIHEKIEKITLSLIATILFFYCENTINTLPLIELSPHINHLFYQSVIFVNMVTMTFLLVLFVNQLEENELKLNYQAKTDALTNIANRHHFFEQCHIDIVKSIKSDRPLSIILLNVDYFKQINDKYGYCAGDKCLINTANMIKKSINSQGLCARIGGEEFIISLPETTLKEANNIAEYIRIAIEKSIIHIDNMDESETFQYTASFGIANLTDEVNNLKSIIIQADTALTEAKIFGKNRVASNK